MRPPPGGTARCQAAAVCYKPGASQWLVSLQARCTASRLGLVLSPLPGFVLVPDVYWLLTTPLNHWPAHMAAYVNA